MKYNLDFTYIMAYADTFTKPLNVEHILLS